MSFGHIKKGLSGFLLCPEQSTYSYKFSRQWDVGTNQLAFALVVYCTFSASPLSPALLLLISVPLSQVLSPYGTRTYSVGKPLNDMA